MPYLNKNLNAIPTYLVDLSGNPIGSFGGTGPDANGSPTTGNPVLVAGSDGTNTRTVRTISNGQIVTSLAAPTGGFIGVGVISNDGISGVTTTNGLSVLSSQMMFNGTTWDRARGNTAGAFVQGSSASGVSDDGSNPIKVGGVGWATAPADAPDGSRVNAWMSRRGAQYVILTRADGLQGTFAGPNDSASNGVAGPMTLSYPLVFNGTTWDRQRGDTNGIYMHGNVASGGADSGNPVKTGGVALGGAVAAATAGQRLNFRTDLYGSLRTTGTYVKVGTPVDGYQYCGYAGSSDDPAFSTIPVNANHVYNGSGWYAQRGDLSGTFVHAPTNSVDTSLSGSISTSGATASVAFVSTARQEVINSSTGTLWARWGAAPAVNGAGSFPIAPGGSYSTDRTTGTLQLLSTAATQTYTVNRFA